MPICYTVRMSTEGGQRDRLADHDRAALVEGGDGCEEAQMEEAIAGLNVREKALVWRLVRALAVKTSLE